MKEDPTESTSSPVDLVWHYTSPDGLSGILEHNVLWATSAAFMNDVHELSSGARALYKHFDRIRASLPEETVQAVQKEMPLRTIDAQSAYIVSVQGR